MFCPKDGTEIKKHTHAYTYAHAHTHGYTHAEYTCLKCKVTWIEDKDGYREE